jgi:transcriptional regulator with XRE-family HTH domain
MPKNTTVDPTGVEINGAKLRILRKLSGQTMTAFARRCGIHLSYVSHIERGARGKVSPDKFAAICDALDIPADRRDTMLTADARRRVKQAA